MVPTLLARVDGLPAELLEREQVWPANGDGGARSRRSLSARARARVERQTAVVHPAMLPRRARDLIDADSLLCSPFAEAEAERMEILQALDQAGLR
jgi:hypothetical protein